MPTDAERCPHDGAPARAVTSLPEGTQVGSYRIVRLLGEGGMGFVYESIHDVLGRRSAIKFLRTELTANADLVTRFLQEAKAVNLIDHDNIINVYDYGDGREGAVYFVMEFLEGETLGALIHRRKRLNIALFVHVFAQLMSALAAAHAKQVVHRDLKPANVLIVKREANPFFVKLLDFGVAKLTGEGAVAGLTSAGSLIGTPQYMSPEQVLGKPADARSDVFSLGVMMYLAIVGELPFSGSTFGQLAPKILTDEPTPPGVAAPDALVPKSLERLISRAMQKNPQDRFGRVVDMLGALNEVRKEANIASDGAIDETGEVELADPVSAGRGDVSAAIARAPARSKRRAVAIFAGIVSVLACALVAWWIASAGSGSGAGTEPTAPTDESTPGAGQPTIKSRAAAGDRKEAVSMARSALRELVESETASERNAALAALDLVGTARAASLLYAALEGPPQARVSAARTLRDLGLPEAAPKIRSALARSGSSVRIELAACLVVLKDRDAIAMLEQALSGEARRKLIAASALAEIGAGGKAKPILEEIFENTPAGRDRWRHAAAALLHLKHQAARDGLHQELAVGDPARSLPAAELLARHGDKTALDYLLRQVADAEGGATGDAALALARLGKSEALQFVDAGLESKDAPARAHAIAIAARFASEGGAKYFDTIAALATDDPEERVRSTAWAGLLAY